MASLVAAIGLMLCAPGARPAGQPRQAPPAATPPAGQQGQAQTPPPAGQQGQAQANPGQPPQGQPGQPGQKPPVFRTGVNAVRVDVIITDRQGNPVSDLTQADFEVYEDNKLQTIDLFKLINSDGNVAPGAEPARPIRSESDQELEASRDDVRLFAIFLDDYHVRRNNAIRVRDTLVQFVQTQLGPLDMVAIVYPLMSVNNITFTRDQTSLVAALRRFEGRKYDYRPMNQFESQYANYPAQAVETVRNQVTMTALRGVSVRLGSLREGRKAIIFVSEGFSSLLPPQLRDPNAQMPGFGNPNTYNPGAGSGSITEDRARFSADSEMMSDLREVFNTANQHNTAIYALDPRGLATGEFDVSDQASIGQKQDQDILRATQDTLQILASNTDGRAIINRNDLEKGLKQVVRDTSAYYLLGYNSSLSAPDGRFHEIKVKLKRPGLQVRSRKGYWAPTVEEAAKATAPPKPPTPPAVEKALSTVQARPRDAYVSTWVGTGEGEGGKTRVTFVWEPVPPIPGEKRQDVSSVRLIATARGEELFNGTVLGDSSATAAASAGSAPPARTATKVAFDAPPGKMNVRVVVLNDKGEALDGFQQEMPVPDFSQGQVRLSTPAVFRTRTAREFQALTRDADPMPTTLRDFRRTERLLIRVGVYGGGASPEVSAALLNRLGQKMTDLPVQPPAEPGKAYQLDLPLASFSPGDYVIEIRAKGTPTDATELIAIKIGS